MKKRNVAVAIVLAAAVGTASLAACNNGNKKQGGTFNLSDYAVAPDSESVQDMQFAELENVHKAFSNLKKTNFTALTEASGLNDNLSVATVKDKDEKITKSLYDIKNGKELLSGYSAIDKKGDYSTDIDYYLLTETTEAESVTTTYKFAGPDGKLLVNNSFENQSSLNVSKALDYQYGIYYVDGERATIYAVNYLEDEEQAGNYTTKYFAHYLNEDEEEVWKSVTESDIKDEDPDAPENPYAAGNTLGLQKLEIISEEDYPDYDLAGYQVTIDGSTEGLLNGTVSFYDKNDNKTGSVTVNNGMYFGADYYPAVVGNYVYFYEVTPVSADATKDYNFETTTERGATIKANYTFYRYDFVNNGEKEEISTDYYITEAYPLYNYKENKFDRIYAEGYKFENGKVINNGAAATCKLILDENLNVCADLSASSFAFDGTLVKLSDTRYFTGDAIYDENCNTVAQIPSGSVYIWAEEDRLVCDNGMVIDYDGKIMVEPMSYSSVLHSATYYGDTAYFNNKLYNESNPSGITVNELIAHGTEDQVTYQYGIIYKRVAVKDVETDETESYTYTFYDLSGKTIVAIKDVNKNYGSFSIAQLGDKIKVTCKINVTVEDMQQTEDVIWILG